MNHLLQVENMKVEFRTAKGPLTAVRSISFHVDKGETLCIVGESGCGKSITSLSIMGLLPQNGNIVEGSIKLENDKLVGLTDEQLQSYRGNKISMIFQEPMTALNPVFTIGYQLQEPLLIHKKISKKEAKQASIELLRKVGIPNPEEKINQYPHQLSGGMRQRVMIAMALACEPLLLIADEPTTALDVTIQAQILDLIEVVEMSDAQTIFANPKHPYTQGLLAAVPDVEADAHELNVIPGSMPNLDEKIEGCRFHPRCPFATDICRQKNPPTFKISENQEVKCWLQEAKMHIESAATS